MGIVLEPRTVLQLVSGQISGDWEGDIAALLSFRENGNKCIGPQTATCSASTTVCTDVCSDDLSSWTRDWPGPCDRSWDTANAGWRGVMCGSAGHSGRVVWLSVTQRGLRGDIASFAPLGMLQHLGVACEEDAIHGDVASLATLTELRSLVLRNCANVHGSARSLRYLTNLGGRYTNVPGNDPWGNPNTGQSGNLFLAGTAVYGSVTEIRAIPGLGSRWGASGEYADLQFSKCADYSCSSMGLQQVTNADAVAGTDECACCGDQSQGRDEATGACAPTPQAPPPPGPGTDGTSTWLTALLMLVIAGVGLAVFCCCFPKAMQVRMVSINRPLRAPDSEYKLSPLVWTGTAEPEPQPEPPPTRATTFSMTNYKKHYNATVAPNGPMPLGAAVYELLQAYCAQQNIAWDGDGGGNRLFTQLSDEAMQNAVELADPAQIKFAAMRLWTSALQLNGKEFCAIMNFALRDDREEMIKPLAVIARSMNQLCVADGMRVSFFAEGNHPPDHICYRGGGFDDQHRPFFSIGKKFRQPAYLPTSFDRYVVDPFMRRAAATNPNVILWRIHIDKDQLCLHANLVKRSNVGQHELEYLFPPCKDPLDHASPSHECSCQTSFFSYLTSVVWPQTRSSRFARCGGTPALCETHT